jgi:hypothetical protein
MAELYVEDLKVITMPPNESEAGSVARMLGEYRLKLNAARHNAQAYLYEGGSQSSSGAVENYTKIVGLIADLQRSVFTEDWRHPQIGIRGTTNRTQNDVNFVRYCFLVKMLGDQQIKTSGPFTREDIDDALQFCNNFRELLALPYYCSSRLRVPEDPPSGKLVLSAGAAPVVVALKLPSPKSPTDMRGVPGLSDEDRLAELQIQAIRTSLAGVNGSADRSCFQLLLSLSDVRKLPDDLIEGIESALVPADRTHCSYASSRDYGKWLVQKYRFKGGDQDVLKQAGAWLLFADKMGLERYNYGPVLFDMHMRDSSDATKSGSRVLLESWGPLLPVAK